jgi:hypothetical protein
MQVSRLVLSAVFLATSIGVHAVEPATQPAPKQEVKRPPTSEDCDPSNWTIKPDVDYSLCEEGRIPTPAQP